MKAPRLLNKELVQLAVNQNAEKVLFLGDTESYPSDWKGALSFSSLEGQERSEFEINVISAVSRGVSRIHLLDAKMPGCLSRELFSNEGVGIMIYADSYLEIRSLTEEDLPELLAISGRSMRTQHLLPRTYEEVEAQLSDYYVMTIDGNVVGSVALHGYGELCELAYLFVKESHKGLGYGQDLVKFAESKAREDGYQKIFALSTEAGGFFEMQHHFIPFPLKDIPILRREKLEASRRNSIALIKPLNV